MWTVLGHNKAVSFIQQELVRGVIASAYLFIGPPHVGKMTLALELAQALNCESDKSPCGVCKSCQKIQLGKHTDVRVIGLSGNDELNDVKHQAEISIDQVREVQSSCYLPPFEGKYKIFIIDMAERLSREAANSLLKSLEEPPDKVIFILLATNEKLLPDTVISRCQRLELLPVVSNESEIILANKVYLERPKARFLIKISHGCLGWVILAASDETLVLQRNDRINELINVISGNYEERFTYVAKLADKFGQNREQILHVLELWLDWWRDLLLVKLGCQDAVTNVDFQEILVEIAEGYRLVQIRAYIDHIQRAARELSQYTNLRLVFEVLMLDMPKLSYNDR